MASMGAGASIASGMDGQTGIQSWLGNSLQQEVISETHAAALTIGPCVSSHLRGDTRLDCVLFATDFSRESSAAATYAFSIARENKACLVLLGIIQKDGAGVIQGRFCIADAMRHLHEALPKNQDLSPIELVVDFGDPADHIVEAARQRAADLIVLGSGEAQNSATQPVGTITQQVIARATCPVLTVSD